jgi:hypothetical protein
MVARQKIWFALSRAADSALAGMQQQDAGLTLPGGYQFRQYDMPKPTDIRSEMAAQREA